MTNNSGERILSTKFPECVSQGLQKLEEMNKLPSTSQLHKLQQQIIEENVFCSQENFSKCKQSISAVEELVIVRCIAQYLAKVFDPGKRNFLFITLFPAVSNEPQAHFKARILSSLISLAVATHNVAVLDATAVWMQQVGCFNSRASRVSYGLIQDFFQSNSESPHHFTKALKSLPNATPLFTANLITSLAQVYAKIGTNEFCDEPPHQLLDIVINWLRTDPLLLLSPLTTSLPGISLPMTAILAVAPLAKWCIEAPFFTVSKHFTASEVNQDSYTELHLLLLQTLQNVASLQSKITQREVLCAEHIKSISDVLLIRLNNQPNLLPSAKEISLNRLAQLTLVSFHASCLSGRMSEMWTSLKKLPCDTRLMKTLLKFSSC